MHRGLALCLLAFVLLSVPPAASAATAERIADLTPSGTGSPYPTSIEILTPVSLGQKAVFSATEPSSGSELWASDGTSTGTELLLDLCPGYCSSYPALLGAIGRSAVFLSSDIGLRSRIWRTDGTKQGTALILEDGPDRCASNSAVLKGAILFSASDDRGCELWRTDGTAAGTRLLVDFAEGSPSGTPRFFAVAGDRVFFVAWTGAEEGLFRSDGTAAGTVLVRGLSGISSLVPAGSGVLLLRAEGEDSELWKSDGTAAGTVRLAAFDDPHAFDPFHDGRLRAVDLGGRVIFRAQDGNNGQRIWTSAGPSFKAVLLSGCPGGCPHVLESASLSVVGDRVVFGAYGPSSEIELWSTEGTGAGTRKVSTVCTKSCKRLPAEIVPMLGKAFFLAGSDSQFGLWRTDGTTAGTARIAALRRDPYERDLRAVQIGSRFVFAGDDNTLGPELWVSDGTAAGTGPITLIEDDEARPSFSPSHLTALGDRVVFRADASLWSSGGTAASTVRLADEAAPYEFKPRNRLVPAAGALFFVKDVDRIPQLWRTDGTEAGTFHLPTGDGIVGEVTAFHGKAATFVYSGEGTSLWESDGTVPGTRKLFDVPSSLSNPGDPVGLGPDLYFVADGIGTGHVYRLFRTDGTLAGLQEVTTSEDGFLFRTDEEYPPRLTRLGDHVFFIAVGRGMDALWRTDGTSAGTVPVLPFPSGNHTAPVSLAEFQGSLYLLQDGLWKSDGTAQGTVLLQTLAFSSLAGSAWFTGLNGRLYFVADDGEHGSELWRTDGTPEGTVLVRDLAPGEISSVPTALAAAGGRLFFGAGEDEHGRELWESDGTGDGTRLVQDIAPGALSSDPDEMTAAGGNLFFAADDLLYGREPWVYPLAGAAGCQPSGEALCLGGRFRVEASWRDFQGNEGRGQAVSLTPDTGYFWFFNPANVEVVVKALDGQGVNGHHWVFYGALSTVEYTITVTDTQTGAARRYVNPPGRLGSVGDTRAFGPLGAHGSSSTLGPAAVEHAPIVTAGTAAAIASCAPSMTRLCLQGGRFAVEAHWKDFQGNEGEGQAVPLSGDTGYFWFFSETNVEVVLKVLDGRELNDKFWVFYGALSSVEYTITVTDTATGKTRRYTNPSGRLASVADTSAF
jgi:ELWxxDGT repeat protein